MNNSRSHASRFKRLRWRFALSYTAVTVGALLTVELVLLLIAAIVFSVLLNSSSPDLQPYLTQSPPDIQGIDRWMERIGPASTPSLPFSFDARDKLIVIGKEGQLLGVKPSDLIEDSEIGQAFDYQSLPGSAVPVKSALDGQENPELLYSVDDLAGRFILAVPVWDAYQESVLGVFVVVGDMPTLSTFLGDLLPIIGISALIFLVIAGLTGTLYGYIAARGPVRRLDRLADASLAWSKGDFSALVDDPSQDELAELTNHLNDMARQLQYLIDTRRELAVMEERNRMARDLHDSAKQQAFAVAAQLSTVKLLIGQDPVSAKVHIEEAMQLTDNLRQELTTLVQELRPAAMEKKGLALAVSEYVDDWSRQNGIEVETHIVGDRYIPENIEDSLYRVLQESLANVARHSRATKVLLNVKLGDDVLSFSVTDDGQGFDPNDLHKGFGLKSMQSRIDALAGNLVVESAPGEATSVLWTVPVEEIGLDKEVTSDE
jgi:NarL family two-component system sensor histidine kinase LiaS